MARNAAALQRASEYIGSRAAGEAHVVLLGPASRTWYVDAARVFEVLLWLRTHPCVTRIAGVLPFDGQVEEMAAQAGLPLYCHGPMEPYARLRLKERPLDLLSGVDLVVAFPAVGMDVVSADPLVTVGLGFGLPVLSFDRDGTILWVTEQNHIYV